MFDHVPLAVALAVGGLILMVIVVLAVTEAWDRRRARRNGSSSPGDGT